MEQILAAAVLKYADEYINRSRNKVLKSRRNIKNSQYLNVLEINITALHKEHLK